MRYEDEAAYGPQSYLSVLSLYLLLLFSISAVCQGTFSAAILVFGLRFFGFIPGEGNRQHSIYTSTLGLFIILIFKLLKDCNTESLRIPYSKALRWLV